MSCYRCVLIFWGKKKSFVAGNTVRFRYKDHSVDAVHQTLLICEFAVGTVTTVVQQRSYVSLIPGGACVTR